MDKKPQMMICKNPDRCKELFNSMCPYKKAHQWSRACAEGHGEHCDICIPYVEPSPKDKSGCEYAGCKYAGRDKEGNPICNDVNEYVNAQGEAVCGMRDDAIPVAPQPEPSMPLRGQLVMIVMSYQNNSN
jgi:hypothetical protein